MQGESNFNTGQVSIPGPFLPAVPALGARVTRAETQTGLWGRQTFLTQGVKAE